MNKCLKCGKPIDEKYHWEHDPRTEKIRKEVAKIPGSNTNALYSAQKAVRDIVDRIEKILG